MRLLGSCVLLALLALANSVALAAETLDGAWMRLIKADFEPSCAVVRSSIGTVVSGNNGLREEQWFMKTCHGNFEYLVSYYPPAAFPRRASPYEVARQKAP